MPFVLVVEDDPGISELVRERLEDLGCVCETASSGKEALAAMLARRPDLVVLDYSLPDMRADELIRMEEGMPPFIITTGRGDESTAVRLMRAGARDYIIKDAEFLDELSVVTSRVLRGIDTERHLASARADLEARLSEKDALLREIHHRVKNNLQIISSLVQLQTPAGAEERIREIFADIQGRIAAMSLIHETLYESENLARVDFLEYLDSLARNLEAVFVPAGRRLRIACGGDPIELPIDRAVPLGLIANELLTNALKHAFPPSWIGEPRISAITTMSPGGMTSFAVEDNGTGFPESGDVEESDEHCKEGLGLQLVHILSTQLDATVSCGEPDSGSGTRWRIEFVP
jgi:two-component sensor histidine kinase